MYVYPIRSNELYHFGIKRRSGRYQWGSGERPFQSRKEQRHVKNLEIGRDRLKNRIKYANDTANIDKTARKIGWKNTEMAGQEHRRISAIKDLSKEILEDEERTASLGNYTRVIRNITKAVTAVGSTTLAVGGSSAIAALELPAAVMALPVTAAAISVYGGMKFYEATKR